MGGGINSPNPAWDAAYVLLPWFCYRHCGDRSILAEHVEGMQALVEYTGREADDHVVHDALGDWAAPGGAEGTSMPPEGPELTSTAYYYRMADLTGRIARILGRSDVASAMDERAETIASRFEEAFWDADRGYYTTGSDAGYRQTSNLLPIAFGIAPEERVPAVLDGLVEDVREECDGHLATGMHGTRHILPVLSRNGHADLAYEIASQRTFPSWGYWIENGATSLFEYWGLESRSRNHHMFGSIAEWFYADLVGVRPAEPGYETVEIRPQPPADLESASASVDTVRGTVAASWQRRDGGFSLEATIPSNATGVLSVPADAAVDVTVASESTAVPADVRGVTEGRWEATVPSGEWTVEVSE
jgi:alpha-L-rhamnosidase